MRSVNLQIKDDYFEKIISFLEMLPKDVIKIKEVAKSAQLEEIESDLLRAFEDIKKGNTKFVRVIP